MQGSNSGQFTGAIKGKALIEQPTTFAAPARPGLSKPPTFDSFLDWAKQHLRLNGETLDQRVIEWTLLPKSMIDGPQHPLPHLEESTVLSLELNLNLGPSHSSSAVLISP